MKKENYYFLDAFMGAELSSAFFQASVNENESKMIEDKENKLFLL